MHKRAAILNIGTELLVGHVLNTHAQYLTKWLNHMGYGVHYHLSCGDNSHRIQETLAFLAKEADLILVTGGLGPTQDDITRQEVARFLGLPIERRPEVMAGIDAHFVRYGRKPTENNYLQADFPVGAHVLENPQGTAPGFAIEKNNLTIACLPGPPREVQAVTEGALTQYLTAQDAQLFNCFISLYGIGESVLDEKIADLFETQTDPTIGIYANDGTLSLRLSTLKSSQEAADLVILPLVSKLRERLGDFMVSSEGLSVQEALVTKLLQSHLTVGVAESCTGGFISKIITDISGASQVFLGGLITYSNDSKVNLLGVDPAAIERFGAVSEQVAMQMAAGVEKRLDTAISIAVTGVAGPLGGSQEKPVGTVYIAYRILGNEFTRRYQFPGDRNRVRQHTALTALKVVLDALNDQNP